MRNSNTVDSKTKILNSALSLFEKNGYSGTSVNDILNEAELTKGSFYYFFQSKEDLLYLIHESFIENLLYDSQEIFNSKNTTNKEKLSQLVSLLWDSLYKYKDNFTIFIQEYKYIADDDKFQVIREKRDQFANIITQVIEDGIKAGEFKSNTDPKIISFGIVGLTGWGTQWYRKDGPLSVKEINKIYLDMILNGIENH